MECFHQEEIKMYKLLVVDDHPIFRQAISGIIETEFKDSVIFQAESIQEAHKIIKSKPILTLSY